MSTDALRKELNYKERKLEFIRFLGAKENRIMVLATSCNNRVMARNVLVASHGLDLYFFTWATLVNADKSGRIQELLYAKIEFRLKEWRRYWEVSSTSVIKNIQIS